VCLILLNMLGIINMMSVHLSSTKGDERVPHAYEAIAATLRSEILDNTWPAGSVLPTIPDLTERFGVSRITVRGAIEQLVSEGLVYTGYLQGRRGTIVRRRGRVDHFPTDAINPARPASQRDSFEESVLKAGRRPSKKFVMRVEVAPPEIAARLGADPDELVVQRTVYQYVDDEPWSRERSYFPADLAQQTGIDTPHDIPQGTLRRLREAGFAEIAFVDEVTDENAGPEDAADLAIPIGSPLLVQTRTAATAQRVTRVTKVVRSGGRNRLVWEMGDPSGLDVIRKARQEEL
jgi:GntR family transcriptional regulator